MVTRRRMGHRRRRARGGGFLDAIKSAHDWIKKNKIISTVGNALGKVGVPYAGAIGTAASTLGYGRRRRHIRRRRMAGGRKRRVGRPRMIRSRRVGRGLRDILSKAHHFVKSHKLVSSALGHFGHSRLAGVASSLGYGRRRVRHRAVRYRGGGTNQIAMAKW